MKMDEKKRGLRIRIENELHESGKKTQQLKNNSEDVVGESKEP